MNNQQLETPPFPTWEEMKENTNANFQKIATNYFIGRLDQEELFKGAMKRLKGYYERGIQKPHKIKKLEGWFFWKCRTALRDERRHLLGRDTTKRPKLVRFGEIKGIEKSTSWEPAVPPTQEQDLIDEELRVDRVFHFLLEMAKYVGTFEPNRFEDLLILVRLRTMPFLWYVNGIPKCQRQWRKVAECGDLTCKIERWIPLEAGNKQSSNLVGKPIPVLPVYPDGPFRLCDGQQLPLPSIEILLREINRRKE
jgi:hypothetical protein